MRQEQREELRVNAVHAGALHDAPGLLAMVAEQADGSGFGIQFSMAETFDDQDRTLGMDTYCIRTSEGACRYGGVVSAGSGPDYVDIDLDSATAAALHVPERFRLRLLVEPAVIEDFTDEMAKLLGDAFRP